MNYFNEIFVKMYNRVIKMINLSSFPEYYFYSLSYCKTGLRLSTATTKLANSPTTDAPDDIVVSLSGSFQLDFVVHDAPDGFRPVVSDSKNESGTTPVDSLSAPATFS